MQTKKKILVDVDGTLADIHEIFAQNISEKFNMPFSVDDIKGWGFEGKARDLGLDVKSCVDLVHSLWLEKWEAVPLVDASCIEVLASLKPEYRIDIVTATAVPDILKKWALKNRIPHDNFIVHESKHELDYDIYIEDNPNLHDKLKPAQLLLLHDRPWNRHVENKDNIIKFRKFKEIVGILGSLNPKSIY